MSKKGFTLLELLVVVVIIGILALIAAPSLLNTTDQARNGTVKANISAAASSVTSRFALNNNLSATQVSQDVIDELNADNQNPIDSTVPAFATSGTDPGTVVLAGDNATDSIAITGYDKDGTLLLKKLVSSPQAN